MERQTAPEMRSRISALERPLAVRGTNLDGNQHNEAAWRELARWMMPRSSRLSMTQLGFVSDGERGVEGRSTRRWKEEALFREWIETREEAFVGTDVAFAQREAVSVGGVAVAHVSRFIQGQTKGTRI